MRGDAGFLEHLHELLSPLGRCTTRAMFGGHGVYLDGSIVGIVIDGALYLKVDGESEAAFRAAGSTPFTYTATARPIEMSYWSVPEEALESREAMRPWAQRALAAALRKEQARARKKVGTKRR